MNSDFADAYRLANEQSRIFGEAKDCAVMAVAMALDMPYDEAHALLRKYGRRNGTGTPFNGVTLPAILSTGHRLQKVDHKNIGATTRTFLRNCGPGRFLVRTKHYNSLHIYAIVNGECNEPKKWSHNKNGYKMKYYCARILEAYRVMKGGCNA